MINTYIVKFRGSYENMFYLDYNFKNIKANKELYIKLANSAEVIEKVKNKTSTWVPFMLLNELHSHSNMFSLFDYHVIQYLFENCLSNKKYEIFNIEDIEYIIDNKPGKNTYGDNIKEIVVTYKASKENREFFNVMSAITNITFSLVKVK